jgi:PD-(D/E)XK endonuclease
VKTAAQAFRSAPFVFPRHFSEGEFFRRGPKAAPFLFMEKKNDNSEKEQPAERVIELQAVADDNSKRCGEAIEAAFLAKACSLRLAVCRPWGDSERYDMVVDWGRGFWRVQVKGRLVSRVRSKYQIATENAKGRAYTRDEIDFFVVYIKPENVWYVVPIEVAELRTALCFNPRGEGKGKYERYREAWCLLDCSRKVRGWKDIPVLCRSKEVGVRCAVCPLPR